MNRAVLATLIIFLLSLAENSFARVIALRKSLDLAPGNTIDAKTVMDSIKVDHALRGYSSQCPAKNGHVKSPGWERQRFCSSLCGEISSNGKNDKAPKGPQHIDESYLGWLPSKREDKPWGVWKDHTSGEHPQGPRYRENEDVAAHESEGFGGNHILFSLSEFGITSGLTQTDRAA